MQRGRLAVSEITQEPRSRTWNKLQMTPIRTRTFGNQRATPLPGSGDKFGSHVPYQRGLPMPRIDTANPKFTNVPGISCGAHCIGHLVCGDVDGCVVSLDTGEGASGHLL